MPTLTPVDHDPFMFTPVDHDPFSTPASNPASPFALQPGVDALSRYALPHIADPNFWTQQTPDARQYGVGKMPSPDSDQRISGALADVANIAENLVGPPMAKAASGASHVLPAVLAGLGVKVVDSGALDFAKNALHNVPMAGPTPISSFDDLRALLQEHGRVFARWSSSVDHDMTPGAVSRDYQNSGAAHSGLSAVKLEADDSNDTLVRMLRDYSFLRAKDSSITPRVFTGEVVGRDTDGAYSITPKKHLGDLSPEFVSFLDNDNNLERMNLGDSLEAGRKALAYLKANPSTDNFLPVWTPEKVQAIEDKLTALGGPVQLPGASNPRGVTYTPVDHDPFVE